ncbi:hypothetical protein BAE44_0025768 [Dichanthelium oligosanthes]|uniref:DUF1677 domain-containing protein n=1 Tax=Dichanthelium oligosanthes TaxID=888268 RepID=A0A1E5UK07_9POAL|nr:hypothetical protein BAE44_0025768 [Dichanthelium oligosanthes]
MAAAVAPLLATIMGSFGSGEHRRQRTPSSHELRSCVADNDKEVELLSSDGGHDGVGGGGDPRGAARPAEVDDAECECCGMSEECTPAYIGAVRRRFSGRWVCGLCAEAVAVEAGKNGGDREAALAAHMAVCRRFNGFGRTHPALFQADAVIDIVRKLSGSGPRFYGLHFDRASWQKGTLYLVELRIVPNLTFETMRKF